MSADNLPTAARLGFTHVSVAQSSRGDWFAVVWSRESGPTPLAGDCSYHAAVEAAEGYAARKPDAIIDLPDDIRTVDVMRSPDGVLLAKEMSTATGSAAVLRAFAPDERESAVAFALRMVPQFAPCRLGEVAA